ncbi:PfkB family carbohydrate kinase [Fusibacter bizertensis]
MKIICVGDNVVDCYVDQKKYYPGGNAINVAVNCKRFGAIKSSYIGIFGDDEQAKHIKKCLESENIDYRYSRKVYAPTGQPSINLTVEGDRVFVGSLKETAQHLFRLNLTERDYDYISKFDICHTSLYSNIEHELKTLSKYCKVSFDFSDDYSIEFVKYVIPNISFAFFSGSDSSEDEINEIIKIAASYDVEVIGITLGSKGALFIKDGKRYLKEVKETKVTDTMGAGDGFIAGFLTAYMNGGDMEAALEFATDCASKCCSYFGSIGYPHPIGGINENR